MFMLKGAVSLSLSQYVLLLTQHMYTYPDTIFTTVAEFTQATNYAIICEYLPDDDHPYMCRLSPDFGKLSRWRQL